MAEGGGGGGRRRGGKESASERGRKTETKRDKERIREGEGGGGGEGAGLFRRRLLAFILNISVYAQKLASFHFSSVATEIASVPRPNTFVSGICLS